MSSLPVLGRTDLATELDLYFAHWATAGNQASMSPWIYQRTTSATNLPYAVGAMSRDPGNNAQAIGSLIGNYVFLAGRWVINGGDTGTTNGAFTAKTFGAAKSRMIRAIRAFFEPTVTIDPAAGSTPYAFQTADSVSGNTITKAGAFGADWTPWIPAGDTALGNGPTTFSSANYAPSGLANVPLSPGAFSGLCGFAVEFEAVGGGYASGVVTAATADTITVVDPIAGKLPKAGCRFLVSGPTAQPYGDYYGPLISDAQYAVITGGPWTGDAQSGRPMFNLNGFANVATGTPAFIGRGDQRPGDFTGCGGYFINLAYLYFFLRDHLDADASGFYGNVKDRLRRHLAAGFVDDHTMGNGVLAYSAHLTRGTLIPPAVPDGQPGKRDNQSNMAASGHLALLLVAADCGAIPWTAVAIGDATAFLANQFRNNNPVSPSDYYLGRHGLEGDHYVHFAWNLLGPVVSLWQKVFGGIRSGFADVSWAFEAYKLTELHTEGMLTFADDSTTLQNTYMAFFGDAFLNQKSFSTLFWADVANRAGWSMSAPFRYFAKRVDPTDAAPLYGFTMLPCAKTADGLQTPALTVSSAAVKGTYMDNIGDGRGTYRDDGDGADASMVLTISNTFTQHLPHKHDAPGHFGLWRGRQNILGDGGYGLYLFPGSDRIGGRCLWQMHSHNFVNFGKADLDRRDVATAGVGAQRNDAMQPRTEGSYGVLTNDDATRMSVRMNFFGGHRHLHHFKGTNVTILVDVPLTTDWIESRFQAPWEVDVMRETPITSIDTSTPGQTTFVLRSSDNNGSPINSTNFDPLAFGGTRVYKFCDSGGKYWETDAVGAISTPTYETKDVLTYDVPTRTLVVSGQFATQIPVVGGTLAYEYKRYDTYWSVSGRRFDAKNPNDLCRLVADAFAPNSTPVWNIGTDAFQSYGGGRNFSRRWYGQATSKDSWQAVVLQSLTTGSPVAVSYNGIVSGNLSFTVGGTIYLVPAPVKRVASRSVVVDPRSFSPTTKAPNDASVSAGLRYWFKADSAAATVLDASGTPRPATNGKVGTWTDSQGAATVLQATAGNQPTITRDSQGSGLDGVNFGTSLFMATSGTPALGGTGFTLLCAMNVANTNGNRYLLRSKAAGGFVVTVDSTNKLTFGSTTSPTGNSTFWTTSGTVPLTVPTTVAIRATPLGGNLYTVEFWVDGAKDANTLTTSAITIASAAQLYLSSTGNGSGYFAGRVFEVAVYNAALSTADVLAVSAGFKVKWGTP